MAEDITKRVDQLREDLTQQQAASMTLLGIVKDIDHKVDELTGSVRMLTISSTIVDARLNAIDARINTLAVKMDQVISLLTQKPQQ